MKRTRLHALYPASARKKINAAKSNKPFMIALLDRDHIGHKDAIDQWTRLHRIAFPEPSTLNAISPTRPAAHSSKSNEPRSSKVVGRNSEQDRVSTQRRSEWRTKVKLQTTPNGEERSASAAISGDEDVRGRPVVNMSADRIRILQDNAPALFEIEDSSDADQSYGVWRSSHRAGADAVRIHQTVIEQEAMRQGVDPDWVRAIMYVENALGSKGRQLRCSASRTPSFR